MELEKTGDLETVSTSIDTEGRKQPAKRKGKAGKKSNSIIAPSAPAIDIAPVEPVGVTDAATLGSAVERDWREARRAFEALTAHTVAQVAQAIPPGKIALVTEIAGFFTALAAKLTARSAGNGEAPAAIPDDLSIPHCLLQREKPLC